MCKWQDDPNFYVYHPRHLERVDGSKVDDDDLEQLLAGDQRLGWLRDQANYTGTVWRCPMASCDFGVCISCAVGMDKEPRRRLRDRSTGELPSEAFCEHPAAGGLRAAAGGLCGAEGGI